MLRKLRTGLVWIVLFIGFLVLFAFNKSNQAITVAFESFLGDVEDGIVSEIWVDNNSVVFSLYGSTRRFKTLGLVKDELMQKLSSQGVEVHAGPEPSPYKDLLFSILPLIVLLVVALIFLRRFKGGGTNIVSLLKSRARPIAENSKATFSDVGGSEDAKTALKDIVDFFLDTKKWQDGGVRPPKGVLLLGPPGCGKTLLARALAGETNAKFFVVSASEFVEMFVGVGASRVRDMFESAKKAAPAVIFIDELDAVGRRRGSGIGAAHDEREQTLNQLLVCLDGFEAYERVIVIAATNRPDVLDAALLRPGRFDRLIKIPRPNESERLEILKIHARGKPLSNDVSLESLAARTTGLCGADLEALLNDAAMKVVRRASQTPNGASQISDADLDAALQELLQRSGRFNSLDLVLIESVSQLTEPSGKVLAKLLLSSGESMEGEVLWADSTFIKIRNGDGKTEILVAKRDVKKAWSLNGTDQLVTREEVKGDIWAGKNPGLA